MYSRKGLSLLAYEGNLEELKDAISKHDADLKSPLGLRLLMDAIEGGDAVKVQYLLNAGVNPNQKGDEWPPLYDAVSRGSEGIVKLLIEFGADPDIRTDGLSPLHRACIEGFVQVAKVLMDNGADVNGQDENGLTGLHHAAVRGNCDIVRHLLDNGAEVRVEDNIGWIPLDYAIDSGYEEIVEVLLEAGSDANSLRRDGTMPLQHTACRGAIPVARALLDHGADINATTAYGYTALHEACHQLRLDMVGFLLSSGASSNAATSEGWTPLHEACWKNSSDMVNILLKCGANPHAVTTENRTPLHEVCAIACEPIVRALLESGANPKACDRRRCTPLSQATEPSIVAILLNYGADSDFSPCRHGDSSQLICCYEQSRLRHSYLISTFERHFIKMEVAGIRSSNAKDPPTLRDWSTPKREEFRRKCQAELAEMTKQVDNFDATFLDVLHQRLPLRRIESLPLDYCQARFPIYGDLLHSKFIVRRKKLDLLDRSRSLFSLTTLPQLPPECVEEILHYLDVTDLRNVAIVCNR